jgi:uncharacterized protein YtpQ (UPF0354 family)
MTRVLTDKDSFCLLYSKLAEVLYATTNATFHADAVLSLRDSSGREHTIYLDNLWLMCRADPEQAEQTIRRHVSTIPLQEDTEASDPRQIVAMIKDQTYLSLLGEKTTVLYEHLAADLYVVYAIDTEKMMRTLSRDELGALHLTEDQIAGLAVENLRRILPAIECHGDGPWYLLSAGADYVASLLLFDDVWDFAASQIDGNVVAVAPTRDSLMFTGSDSAEGLAEIRRIALDVVKSGHHVISPTLLRRIDGGWKAFD